MQSSEISGILESFDLLSLDDKEFIIDIIEKNYASAKRDDLIQRVAEAKQNYSDGKVKQGSLKDLLQDLEND
ncbi:MAG: hypothetical protein WCT77_04655 [Bacteroidota bacterium]